MSTRRYLWMFLIAVLLVAAWPVVADTGDISLFGEDLVIQAGQHSSGNVAVVAGSATIEEQGTLDGDLAVIMGNARVAGTVEGSVVVIGGSLDLDASARILGDVVAAGTLKRHPDAQVLGDVVAGMRASERVAELGGVIRGDINRVPQAADSGRSDFLTAVGRVASFLGSLMGMLLLGVLAASLIPEPVDHITGVMKQSPILSIGMGLLTLLAAAILVPLLTILIITIPAALALAVVLVLAGVVGWAASGMLVGSCLIKPDRYSRLSVAIIGILILALAGKVPCIGWIIRLLAISWGLGAVVLTRFGTSGQRIWEPFTSLAGSGASDPVESAGAPSSFGGPAGGVAATPAETSLQRQPDQGDSKAERKDDTRRLDDLDDYLDDDLKSYTRH